MGVVAKLRMEGMYSVPKSSGHCLPLVRGLLRAAPEAPTIPS
jgi:hypothetical protein